MVSSRWLHGTLKGATRARVSDGYCDMGRGGGGVDGRCSAEDARAAVVVYRRGRQPDTSIVRRSAFRSYGAVMRRVREREWGGTYESCGSVGDEMSFVTTTEHRCWLLQVGIGFRGVEGSRSPLLGTFGLYTQRALIHSCGQHARAVGWDTRRDKGGVARRRSDVETVVVVVLATTPLPIVVRDVV